MRASALLTIPLLAAPALVNASGDDAYEWAGIFKVKDYDTVQWIAQKVDGDYADATMDFVITSETSGSHKTLENGEDAASTLLEGTCTTTSVGTTISPSTSACLELTFDSDSFESVWSIDVTSVDYIALWAEHVPTEFEDTTHYLRATDGTDIEPLHELPEADEVEKPWGLVILSCILVNIMTFCGVVLIGCKIVPGEVSPTTHGILSGFASGALLGCAVYLILVEAMHLIGTGYDEEVDVVWRWGTAFLGGFLTSLFMFICEPTQLLQPAPAGGAPSTEMVEANGKTADLQVGDVKINELAVAKDGKLKTMLFAICAGDFFHNLVDGFAIGFAFKMCDHSLAWGILAATMYHEIAQEVGDFVLLTHDIGLSVPMALAWNFLAGTSVIIGGLIAVGVDISDESTGVLLAFGGGTYVYLAAVEALPRALKYSEELESPSMEMTKRHYFCVFAAFVAGAVLIGLVLINHEHCVPGGGEHAH